MSECIFCKIIKKEIPAKLIHDDDRLIAFHDIAPQAPIHILIVPKKHIVDTLSLADSNYALVSDVFKLANKLAKEQGIAESGFRIVNNCRKDGGQAVDHLHFHLLGGRPMKWPPG